MGVYTEAKLLVQKHPTVFGKNFCKGIPRLVMATLAKRKRTKASIMVFSSISKRSEHLRQKANYFRNEANTLDRTKLIFEAKRTRSILRQMLSKRKRTCPIVRKLFSKRKRTHYIQRKLFSKRSEHIRQKENYFRKEANTLDRTTKFFKAKRARSISRQLFSKRKQRRPSVRKLFSTRSEHIRQKENQFPSEVNPLARKKIIFDQSEHVR